MPNKRLDANNITICGVGGQGIILASDVLCYAAFLEGFDVKKSEVHGMAQRGGSVITHVRFGKKVYSPLIEEGTTDCILAFEKLEALRYIGYLRKGGTVIVDNREIPPMSVLVGQADYPTNIDQRLRKSGNIQFIDATKMALELGNIRVVNIILLGVLSKFLYFAKESWEESIRKNIKEKYVDLNVTAFIRGREF
ncbi:indolepyruvate oxidoreductase subunit beta [candidate division WOR_3 bacterium SM23_42]|uniref:Indolepyruvate oxidoreductase subunit beta n=1 Tax=candidate division WOR_3 bacterium SM23_42 TaxID=1703779 RepID=A0A0S8FRL9_UNCW3|nr:MAG: indolepyruvate oxidoreductase subunit beta [candidate division WOR_3 bacterium SM23_42]